MLKIRHHFSLPHIAHASHPITLSEPGTENDELIQAIENDYITHGNDWTLTGTPDVKGLEKFWSQVEDDIRHDPEWFQFADE